MIKVKYFDSDKNLWGDKRNPKEPLQIPPVGMQWKVSNTDFRDLETERLYESFCDFLTCAQPTVALLHVSASLLPRIRSNKFVRKMYALIEPRSSDEPLIGLVQVGIPVEVHETKDYKALKTLWMLSIGSLKGASLSLIVAAAAENSGSSQRATEPPFPLKVSDTDVMVLVSSMFQNSPNRENPLRETLKAANYVDALEKFGDRTDHHTSWSIWTRSSKYEAVNVERMGRQLLSGRHLIVTLAIPSQQPNIDIPAPRSAKIVTGKGGALLKDPAVLSAEVSKNNASSGGLMMLLKKNMRWRLEQSFTLKGQDAKLTQQESIFDVSKTFSTPAEAVEHLNATKEWPADFCVVYPTVLYADLVPPPVDRQTFRRYAKDNHKVLANYLLSISGSSATPSSVAPGAWQRATADYAMPSRAAPQHPVETPREWSESSSIIIYQITPREMKFNVSHLIGLTKDALHQTILFLNKHHSIPQDKNPLFDYPYDYALLHSVEHQGFWLIAAKHVPCDIVACRMMVK